MPSWPGYLELLESGELARRAREAVDALADCVCCPRLCHADRSVEPGLPTAPPPLAQRAPHKPEAQARVDRCDSLACASGLCGAAHSSGEGRRPGYCRTGRAAVVSSAFAHLGEEDCLRGWAGSGTIFFTHCNLRCEFCQNFEISWEGEGRPVDAEQLAELMLSLQARDCHNINFVTPSHVVPQILEALVVAARRGLRLPLVYNTGGYDRVETLRWLDGVVDVYMPDFKFWRGDTAQELAAAADYPEVARAALAEMHRQVGDLVLDAQGLARRGLLVRHLVMPGGLDETREILAFLAREISPDTFVNIMPQYRPEGLAGWHPTIARPLRTAEFQAAMQIAREVGLRRFARS